ncbi:MAG: HNH endonuclease [Spirulinaceae cyanobacterium]
MISQSLRRQVRERAKGCCEYCLSQEQFSPTPFSVEHIILVCKSGADTLDNLAWSCQDCNNHKYTQTHVPDPITQQEVRLYHPRQDQWSKHFAWHKNYSVILGLTPIGRATIARLKMNRLSVVNLRQILYHSGLHPRS